MKAGGTASCWWIPMVKSASSPLWTSGGPDLQPLIEYHVAWLSRYHAQRKIASRAEQSRIDALLEGRQHALPRLLQVRPELELPRRLSTTDAARHVGGRGLGGAANTSEGSGGRAEAQPAS
mmetsp:Transcript_14320/g.39099  ORF Transcript_14320/g.39099 Transcript_14320/m.39099 type:complete len:121 (+) Transcript_14320:1015-1377(+)